MKTRFFALATLVLALAACNNDNENLNGDPVAASLPPTSPSPPAPAEPPGITATVSASPTSATTPSTATCLSSVKNGKFEAEKRSSISKIQRPILSAPTIRTTRREVSSQPRPMPRRSRTSLPLTSSLPPEPLPVRTILK